MFKLKKLSPNLNAYSFKFSENILDDLRNYYIKNIKNYLDDNIDILDGGKVLNKPIIDHNYYIYSYDKDPLFWLSCNNELNYQIYLDLFEKLDIEKELKKIIDFQERIIVYCGFFVISNQINKELWHYDYGKNANAYTFITPLFELEEEHGNLFYESYKEEVEIYKYKLGEGIILGENFLHCTEPFSKTNNIRVLLSFTFGTDKMKYWQIIKKNIGIQSNFFKLPCGHLKGKCLCELKHRFGFKI